jgi:hypothetical protein
VTKARKNPVILDAMHKSPLFYPEVVLRAGILHGLYSKTGPIGKARNQEVATHVQPLRGPAKAALVSSIAKKRATFLKGTSLAI